MAIGETVANVPGSIGGGRVARPFDMGGERLRVGRELTEEQIRAIPISNRRVLIEKGWLHVWPKPPQAGPAQQHIVNAGFGKYDVIHGVKVAEGIGADEVFEMTGQMVGKKKAAEAA